MTLLDSITYENIKAEGDAFLKRSAYKKAITCYSSALNLNPGDLNCLVSRAQCYLELGDANAALEDAETTLSKNANYIKGLQMKAEALYLLGKFEYALIFYHRGNALRPGIQPFRLGIQKSEEAIKNSIGVSAKMVFDKSLDHKLFYELQEEEGLVSKRNRVPIKKRNEPKKAPAVPKNTKTTKQLLGELYSDKIYLERLLNDMGNKDKPTKATNSVCYLANDCLDYLHGRSHFWEQQNPLRSRNKKKTSDVMNDILINLEKIDEAHSNGKYKTCLKIAKQMLKEIDAISDNDLATRHEIVASLHSSMGNAYLELEDFDKALENHRKDMEIANQYEIADALSRATDNMGRVYARSGDYKQALDTWENKLSSCEKPIERTWLCHEIGRCYIELEEYETAKEYGEKSQQAAEEADDNLWKMNACILTAQCNAKLENYTSALEKFSEALEFSNDKSNAEAIVAIKKAMESTEEKMQQEPKEAENDEAITTDDKTDDDMNEKAAMDVPQDESTNEENTSHVDDHENVTNNDENGELSNDAANFEDNEMSVT